MNNIIGETNEVNNNDYNQMISDTYDNIFKSIKSHFRTRLVSELDTKEPPNLYVDNDIAIYKPRNIYRTEDVLDDSNPDLVKMLRILKNYYIQFDNLLRLYRNRVYEVNYHIDTKELVLILAKSMYGSNPIEMMKIRLYLERCSKECEEYLDVKSVRYEVSPVSNPELDKYL